MANEQGLPVDETRLAALARHTLASEEIDSDAELSVLFVTSDHIRRLNARFAGDDYATDVLAFPMMEEEEESLLLGDVVVCPEVALASARRLGHPLDDELATLVVHGTLHLLGYDHQGREDANRMQERVREVIRSFNLSATR
ncbi:MAG: rRNA maturation RNase YbeY [Actinomycetota bacterium]|nr:rRNA maturation RNase YbeY [Actinomycetota bacterium]